MYNYKIDNEIKIKRVGDDMLEFDVGGSTAKILTEDLAAVVTEELPRDRAKDLLSACEEKMISKGQVRIRIKAARDMKKGEEIRTTLDITRYIDDVNKRANDSPIVIPSFVGVRTNNQGFIY